MLDTTSGARRRPWLILLLALLAGCQNTPPGTAAPPAGWANNAPTLVEQVVDRGETQLLDVSQGEHRTWVEVPDVGARVGDYVLLGQGTPRFDVEIAEVGTRAEVVVDIAHARAVDLETARRLGDARIPADALGVGEVYAQLDARADEEVVVHGVVTRVAGAIGWYWVHLRDASGGAAVAALDLTVKTRQAATEGQRVAYRGMLRKDVDLGFGYFYDALVEEGVFVE